MLKGSNIPFRYREEKKLFITNFWMVEHMTNENTHVDVKFLSIWHCHKTWNSIKCTNEASKQITINCRQNCIISQFKSSYCHRWKVAEGILDYFVHKTTFYIFKSFCIYSNHSLALTSSHVCHCWKCCKTKQ